MDGGFFGAFHVDVGIGDEVLEPLDVVTGRTGSACRRATVLISSHFAEQQFAEKLHAYTLPRAERANTRTKDSHRHGAFGPHREA